ncbi:MAG: type II toxin-antitoxin system RelE/ParE family toxin [Cellvibrio sp.]|nr:type II toxin-antitoxin system RelE/ParE family toxin [Cellvibrio sp.]
MEIIWSPLAIQKISDFAELIALDKPMAVQKWAEGIFDSVQRTSDLPYSGKQVPEIQRDEIREVFYGNYRIIYKISSATIYVLTVRHRRQLLDDADLGLGE